MYQNMIRDEVSLSPGFKDPVGSAESAWTSLPVAVFLLGTRLRDGSRSISLPLAIIKLESSAQD